MGGGGGGRHSKKRSLPLTEIILPGQGQENSGSPGIDGHTEAGCRLQGYKIWLLLRYHDPEGVTKREQILKALYGHGLRGGENQLAVRYPRGGNSWDGAHRETPAKTRWWRPKGQSTVQNTGPQTGRLTHPTRNTRASSIPDDRVSENTRHSGRQKLGNPPLRRTEAQRLRSLTWTEIAEQTRSVERGRTRDIRQPPSFPPGKDDWRARTQIEDDFQGSHGQYPPTTWHKASDRGELARDVGNNIGGQGRGRGEASKRMKYSIRPTGQTASRMQLQEPASATNTLKGNPPTGNWGGTLSRGLLPQHSCVRHRSSRSRRKGRHTIAPLLLPAQLGWGRGGGCRRLVLRPRHHGRGAAMGSRGSGRGPSLGRTSRRYPRNLRWMQCPVNKSVGRSYAQLVQGRVEQRRREMARRRGKASTPKRVTS